MGTQNIGKPPATYRRWNGKQYILDEFTYSGLTENDATKRAKMWRENGYSTRSVKIEKDGKIGYILYRQYEP